MPAGAGQNATVFAATPAPWHASLGRRSSVVDFLSLARSSLRGWSFGSFAQIVLYLGLSGPNLRKYVRKTRMICSIQKSDVLCFQVLLSFVPTIFHFL